MRYLALVLLLTPAFASAQITAPKTFADVVALLLSYVTLAIPVIFALTFVVFIWGLIKAWILNGGDAKGVEQGKSIALWGVIGLVVMAGLWGILTLVRLSVFGI